ncbi:MAG: Ldh family oxidoreductase, partial [Microbacteriaceae bacterium]
MSSQHISIPALQALLSQILRAVAVPEDEAELVARDLVAADQQGRGSHGVMMLGNYVSRIQKSSVSARSTHTEISNFGAVAVIDAHNSLGQITGHYAMELALKKAKEFGLGAIAVRNAFHLGVAGNYVEQAANAGMLALVTTNTRPLMPAPGGAEAVVGNNPIAFGAPRASADPIVLDLALSEAAMGKIRLAAAQNQKIPTSWATDASGTPTDDPQSAITGMLLPSGGAKGYGLALMVDIMSGALSGGGFGQQVNGLFGDLSVPYNCSAIFLAINPEAFG